MAAIGDYLILSFSLMAIGVAGVIIRRNALVALFSVDLILLGAAINFVAFGRLFGEASGQTTATLVAVVAALEGCVAFAILASIFRQRLTAPARERTVE